MEKVSIAFDFDGVLADSNILKYSYLQAIGLECLPDKYHFYQTLQDKYSVVDLDQMYAEMMAPLFDLEKMLLVPPIKDARILLETFSDRLQMDIYIVTNRPVESLELVWHWLVHNKLDGYIKNVISSAGTSKQSVCIQNNICILCDDDIRHVCNCIIPKCILFAPQKHFGEEKDIITVDNLLDIIAYIEKYRKESIGKMMAKKRFDHNTNQKERAGQKGYRKTKVVGKSTKPEKGKYPEKGTKPEKSKYPEKTAKPEKSPCPANEKCGSCVYLGMSYEKQLKKKEQYVAQLLEPFGKCEPIIGMENPYHYRNKVHATFGFDRKGNVFSETYEESTHKIVPIENCLLESEKADAILATIRKLLPSFKIRVYDEKTGYGLLRRVLIRVGKKTGQVMVVFVLSSPILPSKNNFVKALRKEHPEISTVVINVNDRFTSMILGDKQQVIYGPGYIEDELCGFTFRISPKSFYQVNPVQTEILYGKALEYAGLTGPEAKGQGNALVLDAYCGIGTIGMAASRYAKQVIGVELNGDAVRDARANAKRNGVENISFYEKDAGEFLTQMAKAGEHLDLVFMDPPRSGSSEEFIRAIGVCQPEKVVYISCNPETLARDLKLLRAQGYRYQKGVAVDMFAWTSHVETVCLLSKKAPV